MSGMRLLIVSGRTLNRTAMAAWGSARRWWRVVARSRSASVRTGRRPVPGAASRRRWPRRLSRLVSRCWSCVHGPAAPLDFQIAQEREQIIGADRIDDCVRGEPRGKR